MATQQYESVEQIDKAFDKRLRDVDDPLEQATLRAERAEAISAFHQAGSQADRHRAWVVEAVAKHGIPEDLVDMIDRFSTQEEIDKAAERLGKIAKATPAAEPTAAELYGGGAGGGAIVHQSKDKEGEWLTSFEEKWNNHEPMAPQEYQRYIQTRLGRHTATALKDVGKRHLWGDVQLPAFERF